MIQINNAQNFAITQGFDLKNRIRKEKEVGFRQHMCRILRDFEKIPHNNIAMLLNYKAHATVMSHCKTHSNLCDTDSDYKEAYLYYLAKWKIYRARLDPIRKISIELKEDWNDPDFEKIQKKLTNNDFEVLAVFIKEHFLSEKE